jgi:5'-3' exonuclease
MFRAIFAGARTKSEIPATYSTMSMIISCLKELNATLDDKIIIAIDGKNSWRKDYDTQYKSNRKANREKHDIDWDYWFREYDKLKQNIAENTPFLLAHADRMEADDIIAYAVRYYKDHECIIVSTDSDYEQLTCYENVKVFSPVSKKFKIVKNPYALLAKKIEMERADNLLSPILTEADYNKRKMLVDLTTLPDFVEKSCKIALDNLKSPVIMFNYERLRFKGLHKRLIELFNKPKKESKYVEML